MAQHGTATMYRNGCRCNDCCASNAKRGRDYRAKNPTRRGTRGARNVVAMPTQPTPQPVPQPPNELGDNEAAVIAQCEQLGKAAAEKPSLVAQAKTLARILDRPDLMPMHATTSRQLQALLASLDGPKKKSRGRLAAVQAMTPRKAAQ